MQIDFNKHVYRLLISAAAITIASGTIVYHFTEHLTWVNAYYFSVVTLSTVGYGDITPHTNFGKIFTTFYIFIGVGILTTFLSYTVRRQGWKHIQRQEGKAEKKK